ncbi:MAG: acetylxylan esterase [Lentisphaerae bacterium]|nr:acetylxylan esterase [Lentisphaerota bacterium]
MIQHSFPFDPTCGYGLDSLLAIEPPATCPADFDAFWSATYAEVLARPTELRVEAIWSPDAETALARVEYTSLGGARIGAFISRPRESRGGLVIGHGYGSFAGPVLRAGLTVIVPNIRGFGLSTSAAFPWQASRHVLCGIESRESYILRGAVADLWQAASVLLELYPDTAANLVYSGGSFGGGLGALALPWDRRFRAGCLDVPTFGHHPLRLRFQSNGSGEAVRQYHAAHPEVEAVLAWYDAATAATRMRIPVICSPALFDPTVVPPGQFAIHNALPQAFRQSFILQAGHWTSPDDAPTRQAIAAATEALFLTP